MVSRPGAGLVAVVAAAGLLASCGSAAARNGSPTTLKIVSRRGPYNLPGPLAAASLGALRAEVASARQGPGPLCPTGGCFSDFAGGGKGAALVAFTPSPTSCWDVSSVTGTSPGAGTVRLEVHASDGCYAPGASAPRAAGLVVAVPAGWLPQGRTVRVTVVPAGDPPRTAAVRT